MTPAYLKLRRLAFQHIGTRDFRAAEHILGQLVEREPKDALAWNALGAARYERGELEGAAQALAMCVRLVPEHPLAHATLGEIALRRRRPEEAGRHFGITLASADPNVAGMQRWVRALWATAVSGGGAGRRCAG